jgi:hypothetical protein
LVSPNTSNMAGYVACSVLGALSGYWTCLQMQSPDAAERVLLHGIDVHATNSDHHFKTGGDTILERRLLDEQARGPLTTESLELAVQLALRHGPNAQTKVDRATTLVPGFTKTTLWNSEGVLKRQALQSTILNNVKQQQPDVKIDFERLKRLGKLNSSYIFPQEVYNHLAAKVMQPKQGPDEPVPFMSNEKVAKNIADLLWKQSANE